MKSPSYEKFEIQISPGDEIPTMECVHRIYFQGVYRILNQNINKTAQALGVGRSTVYRWLKTIPKTADDLPNPPESLCPTNKVKLDPKLFP